MAFFDELGKKITEVSQGAIAKTKDFADVAKLNSGIADEEKRISLAYTEIGKRYFDKHREDCEEDYKEAVQSILDAKAKIDDLQKQITAIKKVAKCPNCGAEVSQDATFCSACGTAIPHEQQEEAVSGKVCPVCGEPVEAGAAFCAKCGAKIEES